MTRQTSANGNGMGWHSPTRRLGRVLHLYSLPRLFLFAYTYGLTSESLEDPWPLLMLSLMLMLMLTSTFRAKEPERERETGEAQCMLKRAIMRAREQLHLCIIFLPNGAYFAGENTSYYWHVAVWSTLNAKIGWLRDDVPWKLHTHKTISRYWSKSLTKESPGSLY